jgi:hypothetical protein
MSGAISIFDLDDTLLGTPTFSEFVDTDKDNVVDISGNFSPYLKKIKNYIYIIFSKEIYFVKQGDFIVVYDVKTNSPLGDQFYGFIQDLTPDQIESFNLKKSALKELLKAFKMHNGHLTLSSFPGFHSDPKTIGKYTNNEVINDYNNATNKMILTGRDENLRTEISQRLQDLGVEKPNYGLMLYPGGSTGIQQFKINAILDSIRSEGWEEVHFYEDRKDWLDAARNAVESTFPNVIFVPHYITNIKDSQSL